MTAHFFASSVERLRNGGQSATDMASQPDDDHRTTEAIIAAALLLGALYSLPAMIARARIKPRPFRQIKPTEALRSSMAAPYMDLIRAWEAQSPALMAAYRSALASSNLAVIQRQVDISATDVERSLTMIERRFPQIVARLEQWHRAQFTSRIKAATGIDTTTLSSPHEVAGDTSNTVAWNGQLIADVHRQAKGAIIGALAVALAITAPADVAQGDVSTVLSKAKCRGLNIGADQVDRTSAKMTSSRMKAAGLHNWMWQHNTEKHFRPEHKARNGRIYTAETAPNDMPAQLPFCRCAQIPLWE